MIVNLNTKIGAILKHNPNALEAIISISSKFEKLRNPILRKLMAGRASIAMASKISGYAPQLFFDKLKPLGFEIDALILSVAEEDGPLPDFMLSLKKEQIVELDVRPVIEGGKDPLNIITEKVKEIKAGEVLKIINIFEPVPLMKLLEKQGFIVHADIIDDNLVETYFYRKDEIADKRFEQIANTATGWQDTLERFKDHLKTIDVRHLEMPLPMHAILDSLKHCQPEKPCLYTTSVFLFFCCLS